ncbi:MAG: hypothetical protein KGI27_01760 [Thaumarchaeota archaeon]|nr:hypothetical protein [Nitrososphaerota archaeon]
METPNRNGFETRRAEIHQVLTWCQKCGRLSATIPVKQKFRCAYCGVWSYANIHVRGYKVVYFNQKRPSLFLRK